MCYGVNIMWNHRDSNVSCTIIVWIYIFIWYTEVKITAIVHNIIEMKNSVPAMCLWTIIEVINGTCCKFSIACITIKISEHLYLQLK